MPRPLFGVPYDCFSEGILAAMGRKRCWSQSAGFVSFFITSGLMRCCSSLGRGSVNTGLAAAPAQVWRDGRVVNLDNIVFRWHDLQHER